MKALHFGAGRAHAPGEFCQRTVFKHWLLCCFSTPFIYENQGQMEQGRTGELLIMEPGSVVYHGPAEENGIFVNDWIQVAGEDFDALMARYPLPFHQPFSVGEPDLLGEAVRGVAKELAFCAHGYEEKVDCILINAVIELYRAYTRPSSPVEQLRARMLRHPERGWTLRELAEQAGYSVSRFSQLYRERFGESPKAELLQFRRKKAADLLLNSVCTIGEVAEQCGYSSIYHFSKDFKNCYGVAPEGYRKSSAVYR